MMKRTSIAAATVGGLAVLAGGIAVGTNVGTDSPAEVTAVATATVTVNNDPGAVTSSCLVPPNLNQEIYNWDPCAMSRSYMVTGFLPNLQAAPKFKAWKKEQPGEWKRLVAYLLDPSPWTPEMPKQAATRTYFGNFIRDAISMCKVTICGEVTLPPPATVAADVTPPTAPSDVLAVPGP